jgi:ABC-type transport system involved in resistance to organic solvents, periplasmic component
MERDAHYAAVGIATVALLAALAVFTIWLARLQFDNDYDIYDIAFEGPVRGLSEGGDVQFNGIRVGEVTELKLNPKNGNEVVARIRVDGATPVRVNSRAQLEPQGVTGLSYIQITAGTANTPLLKTRYGPMEVPVIESQPSPLAELLSGSGTVLAQAVDALNRVNRVLSDDNITRFSSTLSNVESVTAELEARRTMFAELEQALTSANAAIQEYQQLGASARQLIDTDGRAAIVRINAAAAQAEQAAASVNRTATGLEAPLNEVATSGVPQLLQAIQGLEDATDSLQGLVDEVRSSPREFLSRPPTKEIEVQP